MNIVKVAPDHPDATLLHDLLQSEYVGMYGYPDPNPDGGFEEAYPPHGGVFILYDERAVALSAWTAITLDSGKKVACLKRVYTRFDQRRKGHSRRVVEACEQDAREYGYDEIVLETGTKQFNAIAMYSQMGYRPTQPFGYYAKSDDSIFLSKELTWG